MISLNNNNKSKPGFKIKLNKCFNETDKENIPPKSSTLVSNKI